MAEAALNGPVTIAMLRDEHLALMRAWRAMGQHDDMAGQAEALRMRVKEAGRDLVDAAERDEAQGLLDYWTSAVAALPDHAYPTFAELDDYVGEAGIRASGDARQTFLALTTEEDRRTAKAVFEDLLTKGPDGYARSGQRSRAVLQQHVRSPRLDAVLAAFQASGAIACLPGEKTEDDRFEATAANLAEQWPELGEWLSDRDEYEMKRDFLLRRAEQWNASNRSNAYLARGKDLREIDKYRNETDTLDAFIEASKRAQRRFYIGSAALIAGLIALLGFASRGIWDKISHQNDEIRAANIKADEAIVDAQLAQAPIVAPDVATTSRPTVADLQVRLTIPALQGAVWLGSDVNPQVAAPVWHGAFTKPSTATAGTAYRVLADVNLREAMPPVGNAYNSSRQKAVVRAGTLLILTGGAQAYQRPTGTQYWAPVQIVPRVYVQYADRQKAWIEELRGRLAAAGFDVPAAENVDAATNLAEVRYFDAGDREIASALLDRISNARPASDSLGIACKSFAGSRASNRFSLELWIGGKSGARSMTDCP